MNNKSNFLGMPHGTAANRLRKLILFDLLKRHNENLCFKCGELIETAEELSIEHKQAWENVSVELFWDLDNIAFSHLTCNRPHTYRVGELIHGTVNGYNHYACRCEKCTQANTINQRNKRTK